MHGQQNIKKNFRYICRLLLNYPENLEDGPEVYNSFFLKDVGQDFFSLR